MALALTEEHRDLAAVARRVLAAHTGAARAQLGADAEELPGFWKELAQLGWLGLHLPEEHGGEGFGLAELAVVLEELGRVVAPGPFLPTVLTSAVLAESGGADELLPGLADGSRSGAVGLGGTLRAEATPVADNAAASTPSGAAGGATVTGDAGPVLGALLADVLILTVGTDLAVVERTASGLSVEPVADLDPTRRIGRVRCDGVAATILPGAAGTAVRLARLLGAAEAVGGAAALTELTCAYAKTREQFGRPIGTFQAVKHQLADMAVDTELAVASVWDAARSADRARATQGAGPASPEPAEADLAAAVAATRAVAAQISCARRTIQLHGGIGFTWEHDAHLYLRRAEVLAAVLGGTGVAQAAVLAAHSAGVRGGLHLDLPPEAETHRAQARAFVEQLNDTPAQNRRAALVEAGYLVPHWPRPWGRGAGATEQLVIERELAGVDVPSLGITGWVLLTIAQHGTDAQRERWVRAGLLGEKLWCQLFSEPGAGSDAAAVSTRGVRVDDGWLVSGQKVWTTLAHLCDFGFATVRTDSSGSKHSGVTMMVIDLRAPGVDVRPLREMSGNALFNEVFFDDVFVPDEDVVGEIGQGWRVARATLGNERVSIGGGTNLIGLAARHLPDLLPAGQDRDAGQERAVGALLAEHRALRLLNLRAAVRAVQGTEPGPEAAIAKLVTAEHDQRVGELGMQLAAADVLVGDASTVSRAYIVGRCMTIAGGTSEILRNQIAERLLGLPRDPLLR